MPLIKRTASLLVGKLTDKDAIGISGLRVTFKIKKTRTKAPNSAEIEVYNLSKDTREALTTMTNAKLVLRTGYEDSTAADVFRGDVTRVYVKKTPPDIITVIEALDGRKATLKKISLGYPAGVSAKRIMDDVARQMGVARKSSSLTSSVPDKVFLNGMSVCGFAKDSLDRVADYLGLEWSIQDDELKIVKKKGSDAASVYVISADTGMLESPVKVANVDPDVQASDTNVDGNKGKGVPGWKVKNLLLPSLEPAGRVTIESEGVPKSSLFTVWSVEHEGDTFGNSWATTLEVSQIRL